MRHAVSYVFQGRRFPHALFLCLFLLMAMTAVADVTTVVGLPANSDTGNCYPFGCAYNAEYQQVYSQSLFAAPVDITDLEFYNTQFAGDATLMNGGLWTIYLSYAASTVTGDFATNIGADNTQVFSGNLLQEWAFGDTLLINLSTPFYYNPALGNLLMDVVSSGVSSNGSIYFDDSSSASFTRVYCPSGVACTTGTVGPDFGLVTGFSTSVVPEPASVGLFGLCLVGVGLAYRRRLRR